ncbi:MAG: aminotransferase class V-fold PLP-dependent enzyme, partial [Flavobacteriaceae bacterium]
MDQNDPLASYRNAFHIPKEDNGKNWLYFTGNSLGLQPKSTKLAIDQELNDWAKLGVEGHFEAKNPWMPYHEFLTESMAKIVGAKPIEVVVMNTLTTNLHLLMVSFYNPTPKRCKILIESDAFPSDRYAVQTQLEFHGFDANECLVEWHPRKGETLLKIEDLERILEKQGDEIALLLIGGVNYYTGQYLDLKKIAKLGHAKGCKVGIDLA